MNWFKKLLITAIWISIAQTLQAQYHYNVWFRSTLSVPVGNKFKIDTEFQHRRQNGFENKNMFDKNLMFTLRSWVHYQHKEDIKFSFFAIRLFFPLQDYSKQNRRNGNAKQRNPFFGSSRITARNFQKIIRYRPKCVGVSHFQQFAIQYYTVKGTFWCAV